MRRAYRADSALTAEAELTALATDSTAPTLARRPAARRHGETLTVLRLNLPPTLARTCAAPTASRVDDLDLS
jgi:hypothetical protein